MRLAPNEAQVHNGIAWLLAACPVDTFRDGPRAVEHARKAVELAGAKDTYCLDTLAAACAEAGQFDEAVRREKEAIEAADAADVKRLAELNVRLRLYQERKPYRE